MMDRQQVAEALQARQAKPKPAEPRPFDLEAAKRGAPLVTRDGRKARFVAHVPEAIDEARVVAFIEGGSNVVSYYESGKYDGLHRGADLFMAPKPKRTVWVNINMDKGGMLNAHAYASEEFARDRTVCVGSVRKATAVPVEIEA